MLRIIGIFLIIAGAALFIYTYIRGRQKGISSDMRELLMIISSGYVSERVAGEKKVSPFEGKAPIAPAPKKKRVLSEEARGILEMVERGRETEAAASVQLNTLPEEAPAPKKGTAVLPESMEQKKRGTAVLPEEPAPQKKGTAVLMENKESHKGTAVLTGGPKAERKGTAVLPETPPQRKVSSPQEAAPIKKKGTAVLLDAFPQKNGTAALMGVEKQERKGTAVLIDNESSPNPPATSRKGTAVLKDAEPSHARTGTSVLTEKRTADEEAVNKKKKGTAVLIEEGGKKNG